MGVLVWGLVNIHPRSFHGGEKGGVYFGSCVGHIRTRAPHNNNNNMYFPAVVMLSTCVLQT